MKRLALICLLAAPFASAQDWLPKTYGHEEVAPGIYLLMGESGDMPVGSTGLMVGEEAVILIDTSFKALGQPLLDKVMEVAGRPADYIVNTHAHGDHTGSNQFQAEQGSIIVAHDNLRSRMKDDEQQNTGPGALPVITFSEEMTFHVNGQTAFVFHVGTAHTDGDSAIFFREANVIAPGDLLFRGMFPFIDLDSGGSVAGYQAAMQHLIDMADDKTKFLSGHGPVATRADLQTDLDMLTDAEARVKALVDKGMSADEIVEANPLSLYHDEYNWGFITTERMTRTFIRSLTTD